MTYYVLYVFWEYNSEKVVDFHRITMNLFGLSGKSLSQSYEEL